MLIRYLAAVLALVLVGREYRRIRDQFAGARAALDAAHATLDVERAYARQLRAVIALGPYVRRGVL